MRFAILVGFSVTYVAALIYAFVISNPKLCRLLGDINFYFINRLANCPVIMFDFYRGDSYFCTNIEKGRSFSVDSACLL